MSRLETFLKNYELNLEFFDLETFEDEIMDVPYQIKFLKQHFNQLTKEQKEKFFELNRKLKKLLRETHPKNELQKRVVFQIKNAI